MNDKRISQEPSGKENTKTINRRPTAIHYFRGVNAQVTGTIVGLVVFFLCLIAPAPANLSSEAWSVCAVALLMAAWWMTEALPLATTALLPLILFPLLRVDTFQQTALAYADPMVFLFFGGFLLAKPMQAFGLTNYMALKLLNTERIEPGRVVATMMFVTAFLSMWVSNTATTIMMIPIAQQYGQMFSEQHSLEKKEDLDAFHHALFLGIAYSATIGGIGSLIGTPPNAIFAGFMADTYDVQIGFLDWMSVGVPVVLVLMPIAWLFLTKIVFKFSLPSLDNHLSGGTFEKEQTHLTRNQRWVAGVVLVVAVLWIMRPLLSQLAPNIDLTDAGIAIAGVFTLFMIPTNDEKNPDSHKRLLTWDMALGIRWDILLLFGGGLALADAISGTGLASWIADGTQHVQFLSIVTLAAVIALAIVILGELASNTAMAAVFLPFGGAIAVSQGHDPLALTLPIALAATIGFMLPVATPPNAIVYSSGHVGIRHMVRAGAALDVIGVIVVLTVSFTLGRHFLIP